MKKINTLSLAITTMVVIGFFSTASAQSWSLTGNSGTNTTSNFIGTKDSVSLVFRTKNTERLRINTSGNIGIGFNSPAARLHIIGTSTTSLQKPGYLALGKVSGTNLSLDDDDIQARIDSQPNTLNLNYYGGDVFIGRNVSSPVLYANGANGTAGVGDYATNDYMLNITPKSYTGGLRINNVSSNLLYCIDAKKSGAGNAVNIALTDTASAYTALLVSTSGHGFGIVASSGNKGSSGIYTSGGTGGNGILANGGNGGAAGFAGYFNGYIYTTGITFGSDKKLKKNITDFDNAISIISQLKPKTYEFIQDGNYGLMNLPQGKQYGLVAQDVEAVLPDLVKQSQFQSNWAASSKNVNDKQAASKPEKIDFKTVNYIELIPILIKGMQEQQQKIEQLEQKVETLKQAVAVAPVNIKNAGDGINYLEQNIPNPANNSTSIRYNLPKQYTSGKIVITNKNGTVLKEVSINGTASGTINLSAASLLPGSYIYALYAGGKMLSSKQMVIAR